MAKRLTKRQRCALKMIADAGQRGVSVAVMKANGVTLRTIASLMRAGLVMTTPERVQAGAITIEIVLVRINDKVLRFF